MRTSERIAVIAALALLFGGMSEAKADKNRPYSRDAAAFSWGGMYIGAYLGHAWGTADMATDAGSVTATSYFTSADNINSVNRNGSGAVGADDFVGGITLGTNVQSGTFVFGLEADFGSFNLNGSRDVANFPYPSFAANYTMQTSFDTDWLLTARARVGWTPQSNLLLYATGGLAVTDLHVSNSFSDTAASSGVGGSSTSETRTGWTVGAGAEWALTREWSVKAEYLYLDFGSTTSKGSITCAPAAAGVCSFFGRTVPNPYATSADLTAHIARLGLNYRF